MGSNRVILSLGSSSDDRLKNLKQARDFISGLSLTPVQYSSIWQSEPVGPAKNEFYNAIVSGTFELSPDQLLTTIKIFEEESGRDMSAVRWSDRVIDIDIIDFGRRLYISEDLEIPHRSFRDRLFVLKPLQELFPNFICPTSGDHIDNLIFKAPPLQLSKKSVKW